MKPMNLKIQNNELYLHDYALTELAKEYQTPLYVYDEVELVEKMRLFKQYFRSPKFDTDIVYASKAFLVPEMAKLVASEGLLMDAVSLGDLYVALKAGFPMEHIVFHGNNKSIEELQFAIKHHVGIIVVDNLHELELLENLSGSTEVKTLFRINPGIDTHTHKYIQTALYVSKFGESIYDDQMIDKVMKAYRKCSNVKLLGFHAHIGSQIKDLKPFLLCVNKMISFTKEVCDKYQVTLTHLNLGGGFGISYQENEQTFDLGLGLTKIVKRIESKCRELAFPLQKVMIEPGRSIVGNAGITLYECGIIKHTFGGKNYVFIDGGMTDNIRPALYQAVYSVDVANKIMSDKIIKVDVAGKCCESGDVIARDVMIPQTDIGDILVVYATGAYTYSMSSNYNNLTKPAVIFVGKDVKVVSKRQTLEELNNIF